MKKIFVIGSINTDIVINTTKMPTAGESVKGYDFFINAGGKGANQAIACKKLGADVCFIGAVGNDNYGKDLINTLRNNALSINSIKQVDNYSSGVAIIVIEKNSLDNYLITDPGANNLLDFPFIKEILEKHASNNDILLSQLEIPIQTVINSFNYAKQEGIFTILNAAPAQKLDNKLLAVTDLLIVNKTEIKTITDINVFDLQSAIKAYDYIKNYGAKQLIVTLGKEGAIYIGKKNIYVPAKLVETIDPTAAGDTYIGALTTKLVENKTILEAMEYASYAAAITVTRKGASNSIPTKIEVESFMEMSIEHSIINE